MQQLEHKQVWPAWTDAIRYETASPLADGLRRIIELATAALTGPASDTDLLNAISAIQAQTLASEMEYHGPEEIDDDIPF